MKLLAYYSFLITIFAVLACFVAYVQNVFDTNSFWGMILYIPVAYYLFRKAQNEV